MKNIQQKIPTFYFYINHKFQKGASIIEIMTSIIVMSFLMAIAAPHFAAWISNIKVRNISESAYFGILQARSEAIRRNQYVYFEIQNDTSWSVITENGNVLNNKSSQESSQGVSLGFSPNNSKRVTFNGSGKVTTNQDGSLSLSILNIDTSLIYEGITPLQIRINSGGGSLLCMNPTVPNSNNSQDCSNASF